MIVEQLLVGYMANFCYLVGCEREKKAICIDPGAEADRVASRLNDLGLNLEYIVNTHGHPDHTGATAALKRITGAKTVLHELDAAMAGPVDLEVRDGDIVTAGTVQARVIHTPGHTPGGICLYAQGNLFTGDTLFVGSIGRTDFPGGDMRTLLNSIKHKLLVLPPETVVWPGHDYGDRPHSTLEHECRTNPFITDFILGT